MLRHDAEVRPFPPAEAVPEFKTLPIGVEDKKMTFLDAVGREGGEAVTDKLTSDAPTPGIGMDGEVVEIATTSIMSGEHRPDDKVTRKGDEAHSRIAF
jgi:hypothetical protein